MYFNAHFCCHMYLYVLQTLKFFNTQYHILILIQYFKVSVCMCGLRGTALSPASGNMRNGWHPPCPILSRPTQLT